VIAPEEALTPILFLRVLQPEAGNVKFQDNTMVHHPIDGGSRCHGVLEDPLPFGKGKIARDHYGSLLVTVGHKGKKHLHFLAALLHIADVIDDNGIIAAQPLEGGGELKVFFG